MADRFDDGTPGGRAEGASSGGASGTGPAKRPGRLARRRSTRKQADGDASAALQRMFDGPRASHDQVVHDAVMAGLDAFGGRSRSDRTNPEADGPGAEAGGPLALKLAASDEEESTGDGGGGGGATTRARRGTYDDDHYRGDDEMDEELVLASLAGPKVRFNPLGALSRSASSGLVQAGEMTWLAGSVLKSAITRPKGYWGETKEQIYGALKLCWVPMIVSITAFGIGAPGLQGGNVFTIFGVPEREGSFIVATGIREFAPWIDAMIVAGVVGTAITADIGARRIREEIDAMEVLGVDPIRELVLPRILSTAIITGLFDIVALLVGIVGGYIASVILLGASTAGYTSQFFSQANVPDLIGSFAKTFLFGAVVGVVCCYKGLRASGGPSGVGKAVNSAVVISFALIWTINYVFTNTLLGFAPSTQVFH